MKRIKIGIIGLGYIGRVHLRNCLRLRNLEVAAVADSSVRSLKKANAMGVKDVYRNYKDLLKKTEIEAVIISLPNFLHCEVASAAAHEEKDIFLEKPLARTVEEGEEIIKHAKENNVKVMIGCQYRFNDLIQVLKNMVDRGMLGKIETATAELVGDRPASEWWFSLERAGGGALIDLGYHMIDLMIWFFGEVSSVHCYLDFRFHLPLEDYALVLLHFKRGPHVIINVGWFSKVSKYRVTLWGTAGFASTDDLRSKSITSYALRNATKNLTRKLIGKPVIPLGYMASAFFKEIQHFALCIRKDTKPIVTAEDGLKSLKIISKAYESAKQKNLSVDY